MDNKNEVEIDYEEVFVPEVDGAPVWDSQEGNIKRRIEAWKIGALGLAIVAVVTGIAVTHVDLLTQAADNIAHLNLFG